MSDLDPAHAPHLALLRDRLPERFTVGLVLHTGATASRSATASGRSR